MKKFLGMIEMKNGDPGRLFVFGLWILEERKRRRRRRRGRRKKVVTREKKDCRTRANARDFSFPSLFRFTFPGPTLHLACVTRFSSSFVRIKISSRPLNPTCICYAFLLT